MSRIVSMVAAVCFVMIANNIASAQSFLDRLEGIIGGAAPVPAAETRQPGYLGLAVDETPGPGIAVLEVELRSPAALAGLVPGDRIVALNEVPLKSIDDMAHLLQPLAAGDQLRVKYLRNGKQASLTLTLAAPPPTAPALERLERQMEELAPSPDALEQDARPAFLGVRVVPITNTLRERYGLAVTDAVVIDFVSRGSPADRAGLQVGSAIVSFAGEQVGTPEQLATLLRRQRPGSEPEVTVYRGRQLIRTRVRLVAAPPPEAPLRLGEDRDPLLTEPPLPLPPGEEPRASRPAFSGERPAGRILNRVLEQVEQAQQQQAPARPPAADPRELEQHIELLERYIDTLEARIRGLEAALEPSRP